MFIYIKKHIILTLTLQLSQPIGLLLTFPHSHRFYFITLRLFYSVIVSVVLVKVILSSIQDLKKVN